MMIYKTNNVTPLQAANVQSGLNKSTTMRAGQYDRVEVTNYSDEKKFVLDIASKISQEVRIGNTENLHEIRQQVQNRDYHYDLDKLTKQIMLFGGLD